MTEASTGLLVTFAEAARVVIRRLWLRKSLHWMMRTLPFAAAVVVLLIVLRACGATWCNAGIAFALLAIWITGCIVFAWWRRPEPYAAFAFWDSQSARGDAFANAWWFEQQPARDAAQDFHLNAQCELLPA